MNELINVLIGMKKTIEQNTSALFEAIDDKSADKDQLEETLKELFVISAIHHMILDGLLEKTVDGDDLKGEAFVNALSTQRGSFLNFAQIFMAKQALDLKSMLGYNAQIDLFNKYIAEYGQLLGFKEN